jgi:hypothetical protein
MVTGKGKNINLKFSVQLSTLPPYSMSLQFADISPEVMKVKCDLEYVMKIFAKDQYENPIFSPSAEDKKILQSIIPEFTVVGIFSIKCFF